MEADPAAAGRDAARGREAAELMAAAAQRWADKVRDLPDKDYIEYDHHAIAKVEPGSLWLEVTGQDGRPTQMGPLRVPVGATERLRAGWEIGCGLGRFGGVWELVEVADVYPVG